MRPVFCFTLQSYRVKSGDLLSWNGQAPEVSNETWWEKKGQKGLSCVLLCVEQMPPMTLVLTSAAPQVYWALKGQHVLCHCQNRKGIWELHSQWGNEALYVDEEWQAPLGCDYKYSEYSSYWLVWPLTSLSELLSFHDPLVENVSRPFLIFFF